MDFRGFEFVDEGTVDRTDHDIATEDTFRSNDGIEFRVELVQIRKMRQGNGK